MLMKENEVKTQFQNDKSNKLFKDLYGLEPEMSLLSVNFAPHENRLLNENYLGSDDE
jgi:hypothetical protein